VRTYLSARPPTALVLAWDLCSQRARSSGGRSHCAGQGLERPAWTVTGGRTYVQLRAAGQQPRVLAYGGSVATRQFFADTMRAAGFTSVTVAEEPPLEVAQFEVAMRLASFSRHYRNGLSEDAARDPLAYAFLLHPLSSVDYSPGLPQATGLRWPESRLHASSAGKSRTLICVLTPRPSRCLRTAKCVCLSVSRCCVSVVRRS